MRKIFKITICANKRVLSELQKIRNGLRIRNEGTSKHISENSHCENRCSQQKQLLPLAGHPVASALPLPSAFACCNETFLRRSYGVRPALPGRVTELFVDKRLHTGLKIKVWILHWLQKAGLHFEFFRGLERDSHDLISVT